MIEKEYIENILRRIPEIETEMSQPEVACDQKQMRKLVQEHSRLKKFELKAQDYITVLSGIEDNREMIAEDGVEPELAEMAQMELEELEERFPEVEKALKFELLPPDEGANRNAIVEIRAGTGGDEAGLFVGDLLKMYQRYADSIGFKINIIDSSPCEVGGFKEVTFSVEGVGAYGVLQYEMGVHRVQRVPLTETQGRVHTSASTVAVFPESEPEDDIRLPPDEIRVDIYCASGPGGQCVNTTYSAIRITHLPTGLVAQSQDERSQQRNKEKAMSVLKARILAERKRIEEEKMGAARRSQIGSGDRSERIRTYNFPQNRLSDHRINLTLYSLDRIMEGGMQELLTALKNHDLEARIDKELSALV
jgi:peptide chain release factor 1